MNQYDFNIISKRTGGHHSVACTARTEQIAREQIVIKYGAEFEICDRAAEVRKAHELYCEIDASMI